MTPAVIVTRVVPHYRIPVFEELHRRYGWLVAAAAEPPPDTALNTVTDRPFIRTFPFRFPVKGMPYLCSVPIRRVLAELRPRAVIAEFSMQMSSTYALAAMRAAGRGPATLFWSHGFNVHRGFATAPARAAQAMRARVAAQVDGHICYGPEGKAFLDRHLDPSRVFVALNTVVPSFPSPAAEDDGGCAGPTFLSVSRLVPEKEIPRLVRVFRRLHAEFPAARLIIVGEGPDHDAALAEGGPLAEQKIVRFAGAVYDPQALARLFAQADAMVFGGAVGLGANHALLHGVPVIAFPRTDAGPPHCPEFMHVRHGVTGLLAAGYNDEALLAVLRGFAAAPREERAVLRASAAAYAESALGLERMLEGFADVQAYLSLREGTPMTVLP